MVHDTAYKFRMYPTEAQAEQLARTFGTVRFIYNRMLKERTDAFYERRERMSYADSSAAFTELRNSDEYPWLKDVPYVPVQQGLRHLQTAFQNFFDKRSKYPKFKRRGAKQSAEYTKSGFRIRGGRVYLAKMKEPLDIVFHRPIDLNQVTTMTVTKSPSGRYHVAMRFKKETTPVPPVEGAVGIDLGLTDFATLSTGEKIPAPKYARKHHAHLARQQRKLARKTKGSRRYEKQRVRVAKAYEKVANTRLDFLHKLSNRLVRENQTIVVEDLNIRGMVKNRSLARSIADASWSEFVRQLEYKSEWRGRNFVKIDRWYPSSKRCSDCGHVVSFLPLNVREWDCPECGVVHDRDINAAKNILAAGQAVTARGGGVRPKRSKGVEATPVEARTPLNQGSPHL